MEGSRVPFNEIDDSLHIHDSTWMTWVGNMRGAWEVSRLCKIWKNEKRIYLPNATPLSNVFYLWYWYIYICIYIITYVYIYICTYTEFDMIRKHDWGIGPVVRNAGISREQNATKLRRPAVSSVRLVALSEKGHPLSDPMCWLKTLKLR